MRVSLPEGSRRHVPIGRPHPRHVPKDRIHEKSRLRYRGIVWQIERRANTGTMDLEGQGITVFVGSNVAGEDCIDVASCMLTA